MTRWEKLLPHLTAILAAILAALGIYVAPPRQPPPVIIPPEVRPPEVKPPEVKPPEVKPPEVKPPEIKPPEVKPNPAAAIVRISLGNVGCTGTVIGPRRVDGRWWILSAAHCVKGVGQHGTIRFLDGRTTGITVASLTPTADRGGPDVCWMVTDNNTEDYPFAILAKASPPVDTQVWHAGYGVHVPGNRETGRVTGGPDSNGQLRFWLSVSSGDSGGGILANEKGEVVSCVCCTTERGAPAHTFGASPESIFKAMPTAMVLDDWTPIAVPLYKGVVPDIMPPKKP